MELRNERGDAVDPVPFLVCATLTFLLSYSFVPLTLLEIGFSPVVALAATTAGFLVVVALAYHRLVWTAYPEIRAELPAEVRLRAIVRAVLVGVAVLAFLAFLAVSL